MTVKELKKLLKNLPDDAIVCKKTFAGELLEIESVEKVPESLYFKNKILNQNKTIVVIE